jgi:hypothetical protein
LPIVARGGKLTAMGVEFEIYNPARDATFELGKGLWFVGPPKENTRDAWLAVVHEALPIGDLPDDERERWLDALASALVLFCEPDVGACWIGRDDGMLAAERLGREKVPEIGTRYATADALRSWAPPST